ASVAALWAKKVDGLLTVEVVGYYGGKLEGESEPLGEFIAIITARSTVDKGFDIQSQQDVSFWLGKVSELKIDCPSGKVKEPAATNLKSEINLYTPLTERKRSYLIALKEYADKLAQAEEEKKKQAEIQKAVAEQQKQVAEVLAKTVAEALAKASSTGSGPKQADAALAKAGGNVGEKKSEGSSDLKAGEEKTASEAPSQSKTQNSENLKAAEKPQTQIETQSKPVSVPAPETASSAGKSNSLAAAFPETARSSRSSWDSPTAPSTLRAPSTGSTLLYPGRAVAGQYLTVAVIGPQNVGEQYVGLSFNGAQLSTAENGKVVYQVPEDAPPGYSMHLSLTGRPEEAAAAIEILQPLATPSNPQIPNLESVSSVCAANGILTISGHNFDGIAERNRVIVDGAYDANVVVSSPVQLKAHLPADIPAGQHTLCVSTAGLRSNPGNFDLVSVEISASGPDSPKNDLRKLLVRVLGTQNRVRVKLTNQSKDIIKMAKGDEVVVISSGGAQNQVLVPVQRLRWGAYKIDAEILI
ncbi:MAG: IPT/TIG domain-containing protein, partial [Candidatus Obscuribacterales bacterium]|nr:IPT/TIG domain-containing protein [Candidatus Obscuribacterales bacterium]